MGRSMKSRSAKLCAATLTAAISVSLVSFVPNAFLANKEVSAAWTKSKANTKLDVSEIASPTKSMWSYVMFGNYNNTPTRYRVLSPSTEEYGSTTMFLDSEKVLFQYKFDNYGSNNWFISDLRYHLNNAFINKAFDKTEQNAIFPSEIGGGQNMHDGFAQTLFGSSTGLNKDKIFVLDASEITNTSYGYSKESGWDSYDPDDDSSALSAIPFVGLIIDHVVNVNDDSLLIIKSGDKKKYYKRDTSSKINIQKSNYAYWLRTDATINSHSEGVVTSDGALLSDNVGNSLMGVSPALNIDLNSVLFVSLVSGEFGKLKSTYKLTLLDPNICVSIPENKPVTMQKNNITIPYCIDGTNANAVNSMSIMILNDKYQPMNANNNTMLFYDHIYLNRSEKDGSVSKSGEVSVQLPPRFDLDKWGNDYHVYLVAEGINSSQESDSASNLFEITKDKIKTGIVTPTSKPDKSQNANVSLTPTPVSTHNDPVQKKKQIITATPTSKTKILSGGEISLDKSQAEVICGKSLSLKVKGQESVSKIVWTSSDVKVATVDSNGIIKGNKAGMVTITATVNGKKAKCKVTVLYKDVTDYSKFWFEPTNELTAKEVVKGYEKQTKFKPANKCTRAQMVTFIWRLQGEPAPKSSKCKFADVKQSDYFYKACIWGNENGIVEGYKDGTFGPQIVCARKHAVTFLWRLAGKPSAKTTQKTFKDVKKSDYFYKATIWASEKKILAGYSDGTFRPNGDCLRRQMVTFLYKYDRFVNVEE